MTIPHPRSDSSYNNGVRIIDLSHCIVVEARSREYNISLKANYVSLHFIVPSLSLSLSISLSFSLSLSPSLSIYLSLSQSSFYLYLYLSLHLPVSLPAAKCIVTNTLFLPRSHLISCSRYIAIRFTFVFYVSILVQNELFSSIKCYSNLPQVPISSTHDLTVTTELFLGSGLVSPLNYSCILLQYLISSHHQQHHGTNRTSKSCKFICPYCLFNDCVQPTYDKCRTRPSQRQNVTYFQDQDPLKGKTLPISKTRTLSKAKRYLPDQDPLKGKTFPISPKLRKGGAKRHSYPYPGGMWFAQRVAKTFFLLLCLYLPLHDFLCKSKQPIRTLYLGHVTGYQPIGDQYFLISDSSGHHGREPLMGTLRTRGPPTYQYLTTSEGRYLSLYPTLSLSPSPSPSLISMGGPAARISWLIGDFQGTWDFLDFRFLAKKRGIFEANLRFFGENPQIFLKKLIETILPKLCQFTTKISSPEKREAEIFIYLRFLSISIYQLSDPDLPGCSGKRVLPGIISGSNTVYFLFRGRFILPVNRGSGKSGSGKSGSDCNTNLLFFSIFCVGYHLRGNNTEYRLDWEIICVKLNSSLTCPHGSPLALLSFSKLGMRCNMFISGSREKIEGTKVISGLALVGVGAGIKSLSHLKRSTDKTEGTKMISVLELVGVVVRYSLSESSWMRELIWAVKLEPSSRASKTETPNLSMSVTTATEISRIFCTCRRRSWNFRHFFRIFCRVEQWGKTGRFPAPRRSASDPSSGLHNFLDGLIKFSLLLLTQLSLPTPNLPFSNKRFGLCINQPGIINSIIPLHRFKLALLQAPAPCPSAHKSTRHPETQQCDPVPSLCICPPSRHDDYQPIRDKYFLILSEKVDGYLPFIVLEFQQNRSFLNEPVAQKPPLTLSAQISLWQSVALRHDKREGERERSESEKRERAESHIFFVMTKKLYSADRQSESVTLDVVIMSRCRLTLLCRVPAKEQKKISPNQAAKTLCLIRLQRSERSKLEEVFRLQVHSGTTDFVDIQSCLVRLCFEPRFTNVKGGLKHNKLMAMLIQFSCVFDYNNTFDLAYLNLAVTDCLFALAGLIKGAGEFKSLIRNRSNQEILVPDWLITSHVTSMDCYTVTEEPTETRKQPIRTYYLGLVTGYQPIRDQYFLIRSVPAMTVCTYFFYVVSLELMPYNMLIYPDTLSHTDCTSRNLACTSDPDLVTPELVAPRFSDRIISPRGFGYGTPDKPSSDMGLRITRIFRIKVQIVRIKVRIKVRINVKIVRIKVYSRTPIYRDARGKGFCPVNRGVRYIGVK
eukprot:sb/3461113/